MQGQKLIDKLVQTILQQPTPTTLNRRYASFLQDFIDPAPVSTFVSKWLESLGSDQEERCRSDSYLQHPDNNRIAKNITRSAPEMSYKRDSDGFVIPQTSASAVSRSYRADTNTGSFAPSGSSSRSSKKTLVENPLYRDLNLAANNIYLRPSNKTLPESISNLVDIVRKDRMTPVPSLDQFRNDPSWEALEMGASEPVVEHFFQNNIFTDQDLTLGLRRDQRCHMSKHVVPSAGTELRVSTPVPDMLYGYTNEAFPQQRAQIISMGSEIRANYQGLIWPFLLVEFKGDGPSGAGSMWVATNQCLGGSMSCINIAERLNLHLRERKGDMIQPINSAAFSIAMNGTEARLYISWKHDDLNYHMQRIDGFLLYDPEHFRKFHKYVRNIIDWGKNTRLNEIQDSLNYLREESAQ